ncbi:hypothetical protein QSV37_00875 [Acinetobacter sp. VNK23]|uniref:hypothetical protein n=1 Tax=Acinetobacter thutiue TaxID=2998078 RepID=UPI0025769E52|nr:hypothetical protein [Acinetobacter thutiue]MDM1018871.1 hypothetical protein [Acinetobacter thutiue]
MNILKKLILPALIAVPLLLTGCGSGFNPDVLEVNLNTEYSPGGLYDRTYVILTIRSIDSEPIAVTSVKVNDGRCAYTGRYNDPIRLPAYFQIGQSLQLYLRCSYDAVVKVDVETDRGTASYSFK